jgi:hypothetical protein
VLAAALPYGKGDLVVLALEQADVHVHMADIFGERRPGTLNGNDPRLDGNLDAVGDGELFGLENVAHLYILRISATRRSGDPSIRCGRGSHRQNRVGRRQRA